MTKRGAVDTQALTVTIDSFPTIGLYTDLHTWRNSGSARVYTPRNQSGGRSPLQSACTHACAWRLVLRPVFTRLSRRTSSRGDGRPPRLTVKFNARCCTSEYKWGNARSGHRVAHRDALRENLSEKFCSVQRAPHRLTRQPGHTRCTLQRYAVRVIRRSRDYQVSKRR